MLEGRHLDSGFHSFGGSRLVLSGPELYRGDEDANNVAQIVVVVARGVALVFNTLAANEATNNKRWGLGVASGQLLCPTGRTVHCGSSSADDREIVMRWTTSFGVIGSE